MSGLTIEQFNGLFEKIFPLKLLASLKSASNGNLSIDLLHNIALRQDNEGRKAENILFLIYLVENVLQCKKGSIKKYETAKNYINYTLIQKNQKTPKRFETNDPF
ncbi:hypothetical protein AB6F62_09950 [Providencia huaxiensis]|uniref:hypothetical protein n=1 Tax=Providencia huaxiensis TaxID=2027290 RepID=UPI0034DDC0B7